MFFSITSLLEFVNEGRSFEVLIFFFDYRFVFFARGFFSFDGFLEDGHQIRRCLFPPNFQRILFVQCLLLFFLFLLLLLLEKPLFICFLDCNIGVIVDLCEFRLHVQFQVGLYFILQHLFFSILEVDLMALTPRVEVVVECLDAFGHLSEFLKELNLLLGLDLQFHHV